MSPADVVLSRLRRFLLVFSVMLLGGALLELWLIEHTEDPVQFIPFVLCALAALAVVAALVRPRRATLLALRACVALVVLGSLLGVYLHVEGNLALQREISPNASAGETLFGALGGANPLLAPGILAVAAVLALAATYQHPALGNKERSG
jgi:predicted CDP-diglyceride synthetase/phosphatidate cytidylyltransferase